MPRIKNEHASFQNLKIGLRFLRKLPAYLRTPLDQSTVRSELAQRLERREEAFLSNLRSAVFENPENPYRGLFEAAGCELGDVESKVRKDGLEDTLSELFRSGVYLTIDEFKGRKPISRGSYVREVETQSFRNPRSAFHVSMSSGGSRSSGTATLFDLAFIRGCAVNAALVIAARGGQAWQKTTWEVPSGGARFRLLKYALFGTPVTHWFSQLDLSDAGLNPLYAWSLRAMRWGSLLAGKPIPKPTFAPVSDPVKLIDWLNQIRKEGQIPHVFTFPSSAVRLAEVLKESEGDLDGVRFTLAGEPITDVRLRTIRRMGGSPSPRYGSVETGPIGYGCLNSTHPDDVHLQADLHALIQPGAEGQEPRFPERALFITSLHPCAPFFFLNTSIGDEAVIENRTCGCPLESLGWNTHLRWIRSFEKLTSAGMTFSGTDIIWVLEEELPSQFGGAATDYQLVELEGTSGVPELKLHVHPRLGEMDLDRVREVFLGTLGSSSSGNRLMERSWRDAGILEIKREEPMSTRSGKILHFHVFRGSHEPVKAGTSDGLR